MSKNYLFILSLHVLLSLSTVYLTNTQLNQDRNSGMNKLQIEHL